MKKENKDKDVTDNKLEDHDPKKCNNPESPQSQGSHKSKKSSC